ncbi:MAG: type III secretion system export apparatus subunit SctT [Shewanella sp.]
MDFFLIFQAIAIVLLRVLPIFLFLPVFSSSTISNKYVRSAFIFIFCLPFINIVSMEDLVDKNVFSFFLQELIIGLSIAIPAALPFWVANTIGEIIDNQRGATISNTIDPSVGVETSPLSSFFIYMTNVIYLFSPGIMILILSISKSYTSIPIGANFSLDLETLKNIISVIDLSLLSGFIFVLPVLSSMFLSELFLGVLSRYSPQMNTFSLSLTVKSFIGIGTLFLYFSINFESYIMEFILNEY